MKEVIESISKNTKEAYRESIVIDNEKLQELLITILADAKKLSILIEENKDINMNTDKKSNVSTRYTYEQVKAITKIQLDLARDVISLEVAEREVLRIANTFPIHNLKQYNKRLKNYLNGIGEYGFAFPSNWAKALLEETNNDRLVIQAFEKQQDLYFQKDGRINEKLEALLKSI